MINYSLGLRKCNPSETSNEMKVYANAQSTEVIDIQKLAKHIHMHGSPYTRDIIVGVLTKAVDCIREQLLEGKKVNLGDMGSFYCTLSSEGVAKAEDFNPAIHIKSVNVRWDRGSEFADLLSEADFQYVTTREQQAKARKEEKAALNAGLSENENGNDNGNYNGNDNGNGNGNGGEITE